MGRTRLLAGAGPVSIGCSFGCPHLKDPKVLSVHRTRIEARFAGGDSNGLALSPVRSPRLSDLMLDTRLRNHRGCNNKHNCNNT